MRLRTPPDTLPLAGDFLPNPSATHEDEDVYQVEVITPIYGGGVESGKPDPELPIRASGILYQLRFWWRLIKFNEFKKSNGGWKDDYWSDIFKEESLLFGRAADESGEDFRCKVRLRIEVIVKKKSSYCQWRTKFDRYGDKLDYIKFSFDNNIEECSYALFSAQAEIERSVIKKRPAKLIPKGLVFNLYINYLPSVTKDQKEEINQALHWWASFGGIGARTRRGLGSVRVTKNNNLLPPIDGQKANKHGCDLREKNELGHDTKSDMKAWKIAINAYKSYRQGPHSQGGRLRPRSQSQWPEAKAIRLITNLSREKTEGDTTFHPKQDTKKLFPRAAFGLPIVFHFKNERTDFRRDPEDCTLKPNIKGTDRLSSPIIVKAMATDKGYVPIAFLLPVEFIFNGSLILDISKNMRRNIKLSEQEYLPTETWQPSKKDIIKIVPLNANFEASASQNEQMSPHDILTAFLNFFEKYPG